MSQSNIPRPTGGQFGPARTESELAHEMIPTRGDELRDKARAKAGELQDTVRDRAEWQKSRLAERVSRFAGAFRAASRELHDEDEPMARYADTAGEKVDDLARYLSERSPDQLLADVQGRARQNPAFFIGGAFAIGLVAGRFLKAGNAHRASTDRLPAESM